MATIARLSPEPTDAALLRAMGLRPGSRLRVGRLGEPCVIEILGGESCGCACATRVGLSRAMAASVMVVL